MSFLGELGFVLDEARLNREKRVVFTGRSKIDPERVLIVEYPSGYPSHYPEVIDDGMRPLLRKHQHPQNRAFCLFGASRGRWISSMNGKDAIAETEDLIAKFGPDAPIAEDVIPEPVSDLLPISPLGGILIPPEIAERWETDQVPEFSVCKISVTTESKILRGVVIETKVGEQMIATGPLFSKMLRGAKAETRNALVVRLASTPPMFTAQEGAHAWLQDVPESLRRDSRQKDEWFVFIYPEQSGTAEQLGVGYTVVHLVRGRSECYRCFPLTARHGFARIPGLAPLAGKKVVVLGLGALGSRIAVGLARSGVRRFMLVDRDIYEPGNGVRHECGFRLFGVSKVEAVGIEIVEANPLAHGHISGLAGMVGDLSNPDEEQLQTAIAAADLIINATASEQAAHWVDKLCQKLGKTVLHATVTSGAWGGEVTRVVPGVSACWVCQQVAHDAPIAEPTPDGGVFTPGCAQPTFTGNVAEVGILADLATAMAIETLLGRAERDFPGHHVRWFARDASGAWAPKIELVTASAREECPVCPPHLKPSGMSS